jgi:uncharacterized protein YecE (DUF72 family)
MIHSLKIGTCSWNYDSWVGLVYSEKSSHAAGYLKEYSQHFNTVEIDSWFYKLPAEHEVLSYLEEAGKDLTFFCKLSNVITLTHHRSSSKDKPLQPNPDFLSPALFEKYVSAIDRMIPRIDAIELEFEYLNKQKMPSLDTFLRKLDDFFSVIDNKIPLAVETRNGNYLQKDYFTLLNNWNVAHVFSEKQFMPHIYEVYENYGEYLTDQVVIRLLGGDRKAIEEKTNGKWDTLVDEKPDLAVIVEMIQDIAQKGKSVFVYVNNHYEGSAPKTIQKINGMIGI